VRLSSTLRRHSGVAASRVSLSSLVLRGARTRIAVSRSRATVTRHGSSAHTTQPLSALTADHGSGSAHVTGRYLCINKAVLLFTNCIFERHECSLPDGLWSQLQSAVLLLVSWNLQLHPSAKRKRKVRLGIPLSGHLVSRLSCPLDLAGSGTLRGRLCSSSVAVFDPGTPIHTLCTTMHDRFLC
jgi:hypothetical protein